MTATDARAEGASAFENDQPLSACEFPVGSAERDAWIAGWVSARDARPAGPAPAADSPFGEVQGMSAEKLDDVIGADDYEAGADHGTPKA